MERVKKQEIQSKPIIISHAHKRVTICGSALYRLTSTMRLKPSMRALAKIFYKEAAILFISLPMHL
jgi:hypothetical protein